ncbi:PaaI family thioesterase [Janibacter indicus]|uniref:Acyl-coenzyme A thioesterase THEM4 n=1 Tax=Janibacter indicus TaxID=857417 RepID=A0A1W2CGZ2_9MICO|nr:PaaI family thioesterase [Janibacter indicus]SMC84483.1 Acyl-coenzyme A thioesterase PaaI, contains HGG motif [Janibacter indicus]
MTDGTFVSPYPVEDPQALAELERAQGDLARAVGRLVDATVRTRHEGPVLDEVTARVDTLVDRLLEQAQEGPLGIETSSDGRLRDHANPMLGMRNPIAPPLVMTDDEGGVTCTFSLGAAYEGPPGCVHGGLVAAVLDQVLGTAAARRGVPGLTAYLNTTYRRPTLLGTDLVCRGRIDRVDGWKIFASGEIVDPQGEVTAEAEALFIVPRWAREHLGTPTGDAGDFAPPAGETGDSPTP